MSLRRCVTSDDCDSGVEGIPDDGCVIFACDHAPLEKRGPYVCCTSCGASYGPCPEDWTGWVQENVDTKIRDGMTITSWRDKDFEIWMESDEREGTTMYLSLHDATTLRGALTAHLVRFNAPLEYAPPALEVIDGVMSDKSQDADWLRARYFERSAEIERLTQIIAEMAQANQ